MTQPKVQGWSRPLGGCDCYLLALEDMMVRSGQGRHVGVTVVEVGGGFDVARLRSAAARLAASQPLLGAVVRRGWPGMVPVWSAGEVSRIEISEHAAGTDWRGVASDFLQGRSAERLRLDVIPSEDGGAVLLMGWSHLLLDARGIELAWAELARLASDEAAVPEADSAALPWPGAGSWRERVRAVRPFLDRYWKLRESRVVSAGPPPARAAAARFEVWRFTSEETSAMKRRAEPVTGGIFALPWFLAAAMRAHAAVLRGRGVTEGALECTISVQGRKRGARGPIFQNQVSQMFFALPLQGLGSMAEAARELQGQFAEMTRDKFEVSFAVMIDAMRRLPAPLYRRFLRREASGQVASFYHAHTGEFLPRLREFCGGEILDGWHVPSVPQPPGTGLFFSERGGRLTATLSWREGVLAEEERRRMLESVRGDLLGSV
jgi:hypothetical protein